MKIRPFPSKSKKAKTPNFDVYDVIVIGSGSGMLAVDMSVAEGYKVALVDKGPAGGTCLNVGCIPSKMLTAVADRVMEIREAGKFGIHASIERVDFKKIMKDMKNAVTPDHKRIHEDLKTQKIFDYYEGSARFVEDYTLEINSRKIKGETIFIASGTRPFIPNITGLSDVNFLTNESVLDLDALPDHIAIMGGGYIAVEYGHFFSALGAKVTIIEEKKRLVANEEPEISERLYAELKKRMTIHLNSTLGRVQKTDNGCLLTVSNNASGKRIEIKASHLLIAAGRQSNADILQVENTGVKTDSRGFIVVDDYLQTSKKGIWAFGDANGKQMFTHVANAEARTAWHNAFAGQKEKFRHDIAPRAIFTYPPVASVGMTEAQAALSHEIYVGRAEYDSTAMGMALRENRGFAKVIVDKQGMNILGFHIFGPHAPILIQEVINAVAYGGQLSLTLSGMHIHPALSELILKTFSNLVQAISATSGKLQNFS